MIWFLHPRRGTKEPRPQEDGKIQLGVPAAEIAFVHDAETDTAKKLLFDAVNSGRVRVLLGSTEKMGADTNVQRRLSRSITWMRPADRVISSNGKAESCVRETGTKRFRSSAT